MTIQKNRPDASGASLKGHDLVGNKFASDAAFKAKNALEEAVVKAKPKLSELPTVRERLHAVADAIESAALREKNIGFNMVAWSNTLFHINMNFALFSKGKGRVAKDQTGHSCGTVACISGWASHLEGTSELGASTGREILGISFHQSEILFYGHGRKEEHLEDITSAQAVSVLRHFADHGEVRWDLFDSNGKKR